MLCVTYLPYVFLHYLIILDNFVFMHSECQERNTNKYSACNGQQGYSVHFYGSSSFFIAKLISTWFSEQVFTYCLYQSCCNLVNNSFDTEKEKLKIWIVFMQTSPALFKLFIRSGVYMWKKMPTRCNRFLLQILLLAQHVSGTTMPIIRSSRVLYSGCCVWYFVLWF